MIEPTYTPSAVSSPRLTVTVAGIEREAESVEFGADSNGGLPDQVVSAGTGMLSRTGTIVWAREPGAVHRNPWSPAVVGTPGGWPPGQGDRVVITATDGDRSWRRFTGRIGKTTGSLDDGTLTSNIMDDVEARMTSPLTLYAHADLRGPITSLAAEALHKSGIGPLPAPRDGKTLLYMLAAHSVSDPLIGKVRSGPIGNPSGDMLYSAYGVGDWSIEDDPSIGSSLNVALAMDNPYQPISGSNRLAELTWASGSILSVWLSPRGSDPRITFAAGSTSGSTQIGSVPYSPTDGKLGSLVFSISPSGDQIRAWAGESIVTLSVPTALRTPATGAVTRISTESYAHTNGIMLARIGTDIAPLVEELKSKPKFRIHLPYSGWGSQPSLEPLDRSSVSSTRSYVSTTARTVLDAFCTATLYSQWIDEYGVYTLVHSSQISNVNTNDQHVAGDIIVSGSWAVDSTETYSAVEVDFQTGASRRGVSNTITTDDKPREYDNESSDTSVIEVESWYSADDMVEWGPLALPVKQITSTSVSGDLSAKESYTGITAVTESGATWGDKASPKLSITTTAERVGPRSVKVTDRITRPGEDVTATLAFLPTAPIYYKTGLTPGGPAPAIRAEWITDWVDLSATGAYDGPDWAPVYSHDAGAFVGSAQAQWVADYLSYWLAEPRAVFDSLSVLWSPSRQVGDVERWTFDSANPRSSTVFVAITGYSESWSNSGAPEQSVTARIIRADTDSLNRSYEDLAAAYQRYSDIPSGRTYNDVYRTLPEGI